MYIARSWYELMKVILCQSLSDNSPKKRNRKEKEEDI